MYLMFSRNDTFSYGHFEDKAIFIHSDSIAFHISDETFYL